MSLRFFLDNWINSSALFWTQVVTWHARYRKFNYKCAHNFRIDISRVPPLLSWRKVDIKDHLDSIIILLETQRVESTFRPQPHLLYTNVPVRLAREVMRPKQLPSCKFRQHLPLLTACYRKKKQEKPQTGYPYSATHREMLVTAYVPLQKEKAKATHNKYLAK